MIDPSELVRRLQRIQVGMANEEEDAVLDAIAVIEAQATEIVRLRDWLKKSLTFTVEPQIVPPEIVVGSIINAVTK